MFGWLFGKQCDWCQRKIPKFVKPVIDGKQVFCSEQCEDWDYEATEILRRSEMTDKGFKYNDFDARRIKTLIELAIQQKKQIFQRNDNA